MDMDEVNYTDRLKIWKAGAHTVTSLEVQAVKLWAAQHERGVAKVHESDPSFEEDDGKLISGYLAGARLATDREVAETIWAAKEEALQAGNPPMSADPILQ